MYTVSNSLYPLKLTDFIKKVNGIFILNGAFCYIDKTKGSSVSIPPVLASSGLNYTSNVSAVVLPQVADVTDENMIIHFSFYKKYDTTLPEDITGKIYYEDNQYVLHIENQVSIIDILQHNDFKLRLTQVKPLTVEILRDILSKVRSFYSLNSLDKLDDVIFVQTTTSEMDTILDKIKQYLVKAESTDYLLDLCVQSTTDILDKKILELFLKNRDGSKAKKELIRIELFARKFEPSIILSTYFENQDDKFLGTFKFLSKTDTPYKTNLVLTQNEANYFVKKIISIVSEVKNYNFVADVTP